ncbi:MAG: hypothetical protein CEN90_192 [Parcubacteria group bacterium Licking1014_17]|nr:MAG: hypothetical protein CEN90_192 [Parcubacteria group bacterium Licking1014_17]
MDATLNKLGFRGLDGHEIKRMIQTHSLKEPKRMRPFEPGLSHILSSADGVYHVVVHTSVVLRTLKWRKKGSGWVIINQIVDGKPVRVYISHPIYRTKFFVQRLCALAEAARARVRNIPSCPRCGKPMTIEEGKNKSYTFICRGENHRTRPEFGDWDADVPAKALCIVKLMRRKRASYRRNLKKTGRTEVLGRAREKREPWTSNPE